MRHDKEELLEEISSIMNEIVEEDLQHSIKTKYYQRLHKLWNVIKVNYQSKLDNNDQT